MSLTVVKGMQSEIFVPITPPMVWTPVTKELKDMTVALATAGLVAGIAIGKKIKNKKQKEQQKSQIDPKSDLTILCQNKD